MLRNATRTAPAPGWTWPATTQPTVDLYRLRKATLYADIIDAGGLVDMLADFSEGQWRMLAAIAKGKPPSAETCAVIRQLLHQRAAWRELVGRQKGLAHAS